MDNAITDVNNKYYVLVFRNIYIYIYIYSQVSRITKFIMTNGRLGEVHNDSTPAISLVYRRNIIVAMLL